MVKFDYGCIPIEYYKYAFLMHTLILYDCAMDQVRSQVTVTKRHRSDSSERDVKRRCADPTNSHHSHGHTIYFKRLQFAFSMNNNKAHGQSFIVCGLYLENLRFFRFKAG